MKEEFYNKVAEQVMSTYRDGVMIPCGRTYGDDKINYVEGIVIMRKPISYARVDVKRYLMSLIIPMLMKKYCMSDRDGRKVYDMIEHGIKERVKMRLLYNKGRDELQKC